MPPRIATAVLAAPAFMESGAKAIVGLASETLA